MKRKKLVSTLVEKFTNSLGKTTLILATLFCSTLPAQAVNINFTYGDGVNLTYKWAAESAALYWEDHLKDDVTINIHLDVARANRLPQGVLGGAIPAFATNINYTNFKNRLSNDRRSNDDYSAFNNLPEPADNFWRSYHEGVYYWHDKINLTRANAKALGLINGHSTDLDGTIVLSDLNQTSYGWNYHRLGQTRTNQFDLTSVIIHEIGHVFGFVSGIDAVNSNNINNVTERQKFANSLDLFRTGAADRIAHLNYGANRYFSIDGGWTALSHFSTGQDPNLGGDLSQASHWKNDVNAMMSPYIGSGVRRELTNLDLTAFDVIGWDRDSRNLSDVDLYNHGYYRAWYKGNTANIYALNKMFNQYRWGGASTSSNFHQGMDLPDYLAQQGFFQKGAFWSYMTD